MSALQSLDTHGEASLAISQLRVLVELLHRLRNPLGSCVFADEYKFRLARIELLAVCPHYGYLEGAELDFNQTLLTLALHVTGPEALPLEERLRREEMLTYYAQQAVTSKMTLIYNQKRLAATLEQDKQSSLVRVVKSQQDNKVPDDSSGQNLIFPVFNGRSKVVMDMHREELLHVDDSSVPVILFKMPFSEIRGISDTKGAPLTVHFEDDVTLVVEMDEGDRRMLVDVLQTFGDINEMRERMEEEGTFFNRKDVQSDMMRFRLVGSKALMEVERTIDVLLLKRKRD